MTDLTIAQKIAVWALPLVFAITLHEVAHGYVASLFGDQTARLSGRLTINPINHIDLIGTIIVPLLMLLTTSLLTTSFVFGWAKPVPVDARNLRNPRRDMALVALAGPLSNLIMAFFWGIMAKLGMMAEDTGSATWVWLGVPLAYMGGAGIIINVVLAVLNFIPIPPLDGSRMLSCILPPRLAYRYNMIEPYGFIILLLLIFTNLLFVIMSPFIFFIIDIIQSMLRLA